MAALFSASMFATTYTVVGGSEAIFGSAWAPTLEANDMVADGTVFKLVKEGVELPAGIIEYKIVEEHAWTKSYPQSGNASFNIAKSGKYDITFTLDLAATPEYSVVADLKEDIVIDPTVAIKGSWDSWADAVNFVLAGDKKSASVTKELDADTYEFKAILNGNDWRSNGGTLTREAASAAGISGNNDANMKLVADVKGNYTFTWTFETNELAVTYPAGATAKYYVTGDSAFVVDAGLDLEKKWNPAAIKVTEDVYEVSLKAGQIYQMVFSLDGTWDTKKGYSDVLEPAAGLSTDDEGNNNIVFSLAEAGKVKIMKTELGFKVEGNFYVYVPAHANGLYLMSSHNEWAVDDNYMFASTEVDGEYKLNVTLAKDQEIKPAYVENDAATVWYPAEDGNYVVTEAYAGDMTIYFRPAGNEDPAWVAFGGYMYITPNGGTGINNTAVEGKAVKSISNGMIVIEKNGVKFNVLGTVVR